MKISAAEFKTKCLKLMDHVNSFHEEVVITKRGKPVAKLIPYSKTPSNPLFGYMKNSVTINDDIMQPIDVEWETNQIK
jgi:prevent-host-death family protein